MQDEATRTPAERAEATVMPTTMAPRWERRLQNICVTIGRIGLAYLFFSQLGWKLPPTFGCPADYRFTTGTTDKLTRSNGLCDWIGIQAVWADQPRSLLIANIDGRGEPEIALPIGWAARLNGDFVTQVVQPNIRWFGWLIWGAEAFIVVTMFLGLFTRLGALVALGLSLQLTIGLAGISRPFEWEWSYLLMVLLSITMFGLAPGRFFGLDALLRPRLTAMAERGSGISRALRLLT